MMKKKHTSTVNVNASGQPESNMPINNFGGNAKEHPKSELMSRLAMGAKADISKKDMLKLTNKNYENLPEVKRKREEEKKKEDRKK